MHWLTGILGLALVLSPFVLGYAYDATALLSNVILGASVLVVSAIKSLIPDRTRWEYVVAGILGILVVSAPFALNFFSLPVAVWVYIFIGAVVVILSGIQLHRMLPTLVKEQVDERNRSK